MSTGVTARCPAQTSRFHLPLAMMPMIQLCYSPKTNKQTNENMVLVFLKIKSDPGAGHRNEE
jgi:hypothetical protein